MDRSERAGGAAATSPGGAAVSAQIAAELQQGPLTYLATPYTDYPHGIDQAFQDAAQLGGRLLLAGVNVYSPISHCHPLALYGEINPRDRGVWLPFNRTMLQLAGVLLVAHLPSWQRSIGMAAEVEAFAESERPIYDLEPQSLFMARRAHARVAAFG